MKYNQTQQKISHVFAACFLAFYTTLAAAQLPIPRLEGRVNDTAKVFSTNERERLSEMLARYEHETSHQIVVLTLPTLQQENIEAYSLRVAGAWGIGHKGLNNGILVTVALKERQVRIALGKGFERYISDQTVATIIDTNMLPAFRANNYAHGLALGVDAIMLEARKFSIPLDQRPKKGAHNALLDLEELDEDTLDLFRKKYEKLAVTARKPGSSSSRPSPDNLKLK